MNIPTKSGLLLAAVFGLSAISAHAGGPPTLVLTGTIRDFASDSAQATANGVLYDNDFENVISDDKGIVALPSQLNGDGTPKYNTIALGSDGTPIYVGGSSGTVTTFAGSAPTPEGQFYPWYHTDSTYNVAIPTSITLTNNGAGLYTFSNPNYFPIDGQGFGDYDGTGHNFSFTDEFDTEFTYTGTGTFSFSGDDDVYVYINNFLVIDLGGVHGTETQSVDLTQLGLTDGDTYSLDIFGAERHTVGSDLAIQTSLVLSTQTVPDNSETALLVAAIVGALLILKFRLDRPLTNRV
jgi:fibro-slime domain-containing protein